MPHFDGYQWVQDRNALHYYIYYHNFTRYLACKIQHENESANRIPKITHPNRLISPESQPRMSPSFSPPMTCSCPLVLPLTLIYNKYMEYQKGCLETFLLPTSDGSMFPPSVGSGGRVVRRGRGLVFPLGFPFSCSNHGAECRERVLQCAAATLHFQVFQRSPRKSRSHGVFELFFLQNVFLS